MNWPKYYILENYQTSTYIVKYCTIILVLICLFSLVFKNLYQLLLFSFCCSFEMKAGMIFDSPYYWSKQFLSYIIRN